MRVKIEEKGRGSHPSEVIVSIRTVAGDEQIAVHRRSIGDDGTLDIGYPINEDRSGNRLQYLVELPRETLKGEWRVWVPSDLVFG